MRVALVTLVALVLFWAVVMRPARNQQRKVQQLQRELSVGDEVVLSAGIFGTVRSLGDAKVEVEVAPGVVLTVARQVVVRRVEDLPDRETDHEPADEPDDRGAEVHPDPPAATTPDQRPGTDPTPAPRPGGTDDERGTRPAQD